MKSRLVSQPSLPHGHSFSGYERNKTPMNGFGLPSSGDLKDVPHLDTSLVNIDYQWSMVGSLQSHGHN